MTQLVLVFLAVAWIVVLAPDVARLFRPRQQARTSVDHFRQQLDSLGRSAPAAASIPRLPDAPSMQSQERWSRPPTAMPASAKQAAIRRRDIGTLLALCVGVTLAGVLATNSSWALGACVVAVVLATAYGIGALRRRRAAPTAQVHYLPHAGTEPSTVTMIRRSANQ
ncbi:hypothetical protein [Candidatus Poriferisodalis sp.]|uniref:hypothetical protein n=1 Tax=Candidatus Poriferisodalis sp. TaxID=3101277 RepID=UPI003B01C4A7